MSMFNLMNEPVGFTEREAIKELKIKLYAMLLSLPPSEMTEKDSKIAYELCCDKDIQKYF